MPRIVFIIAQVLLAVGIVLMAGALVHKQMAVEDGEETPASAVASDGEKGDGPAAAVKPYTDYQAIARRDLFKTPKGEISPQTDLDIEALKPTELKLKLWGTITGEDGLTRAVIEDQTNKEQSFYRAGEDVASAKIKMILREKVVLSVDGEDQVLEIEQPSERGGPPVVARVSPNVSRPVAAPPSAPQQPSERSIRMKLSRIGPIPDNPDEWGDDAVVAPYQGDTGESGLVFNRIKPSSPLRRLGIRNGDILLSVNDEPVDDLSDIFETLKEAAEGQEFNLNIKRRGRERQLQFLFE